MKSDESLFFPFEMSGIRYFPFFLDALQRLAPDLNFEGFDLIFALTRKLLDNLFWTDKKGRLFKCPFFIEIFDQ